MTLETFCLSNKRVADHSDKGQRIYDDVFQFGWVWRRGGGGGREWSHCDVERVGRDSSGCTEWVDPRIYMKGCQKPNERCDWTRFCSAVLWCWLFSVLIRKIFFLFNYRRNVILGCVIFFFFFFKTRDRKNSSANYQNLFFFFSKYRSWLFLIDGKINYKRL